MTDLATIEKRLDAVKTERQLSDLISDVEARLAVEKAAPNVREAVEALAQKARLRIYSVVLG